MEPAQVRMFLSDGLRGLKRVDDVRQIRVRVALVHEIVQFEQGVFHRHFEFIKSKPVPHASCKRNAILSLLSYRPFNYIWNNK